MTIKQETYCKICKKVMINESNGSEIPKYHLVDGYFVHPGICEQVLKGVISDKKLTESITDIENKLNSIQMIRD